MLFLEKNDFKSSSTLKAGVLRQRNEKINYALACKLKIKKYTMKCELLDFFNLSKYVFVKSQMFSSISR